MPRRRTATERRALALGLVTAALVACPVVAASAAEPLWRLEQPAPPPGAPFKVALGAPGDLQFWATNRGLLSVEGNAVVPRGILIFDGKEWRQLAVVCGGSADTMRIAWAGPTEFWTVSAPSKPRLGNGITLCRFKDGQVVASYGTLPSSPDPFQPMNAATCAAPDDCWFGGPAASDPGGGRRGAFRIHWDGSELTTSYGPQGRGISDMEPHGGSIWESALAGPGPEVGAPPSDGSGDAASLLRRSSGGVFENDPFEPQAIDGVPSDGTELLALDSDGADLWAVGGGAASGVAAPEDGAVARPPLAALGTAGRPVTELVLQAPEGTFGATDRFGDVAAMPGTSSAWATVVPFAERRSVNARARVARIQGLTGAVAVQRLPAGGSGRGAAARIACPSADQCWMVTHGGWLFHYSDGSPLPLDPETSFRGLITFRPNESAAQFVPDAPPVDDSLLLAPPPVEIQAEPAPAKTTTKRIAPLLRGVRSKLRRTTLEISFRLTRRARVAVIARRGGKVVARTRSKLYAPGRVTLRLRLDRKRWPTKLSFSVREPGRTDSAGDDQDTVST